MTQKSKTSCLIQSFFDMVAYQFQTTIIVTRLDNGPKFALQSFYTSKGIIHQFTCVESS